MCNDHSKPSSKWKLENLGGKLAKNKMENEQRDKQSKLTVILGLGVNALLALIKTSVGILGQSPALLADGINSTSDVVYYLVVSFFVRAA